MKNLAIAVFIGLVVIILGFYAVFFQIREAESALVMRFGKPVRQITKPGLNFMWPKPIERMIRFDSRLRNLEVELTETTTKGDIAIIVNTYIVWRIAEPLQFHNSVRTVPEAESQLRSYIRSTQNTVIGLHDFGEFVNSDPNKIRFNEIQEEMLSSLRGPVAKNYGIEIEILGIKQLKVSEKVSQAVFDRMKSERNRMTDATITEGQAEAIKIKSDADMKKSMLLSAAEARAKSIRGQGDAEAAKYYKLLEQDESLAMFLRDIDALKNILSERTTVVFSADTEPFKLLREMPKFDSDKGIK